MTRMLVLVGNTLKLRTHETFNGAEYDTIATNLDDDLIKDILNNNGLNNVNPVSVPAFIIENDKLFFFRKNGKKELLCQSLRKSYVSESNFAEAVRYPIWNKNVD